MNVGIELYVAFIIVVLISSLAYRIRRERNDARARDPVPGRDGDAVTAEASPVSACTACDEAEFGDLPAAVAVRVDETGISSPSRRPRRPARR